MTRFNLAFVLHQMGRHDAAITEFQRTVTDTPTNDRAWYGLGLCLADVGRLEQAVDALRQAAKLQYFNPHAGHHLALALHKLGRADEAREEYERVNSFDPKAAEQLRLELGIARAD